MKQLLQEWKKYIEEGTLDIPNEESYQKAKNWAVAKAIAEVGDHYGVVMYKGSSDATARKKFRHLQKFYNEFPELMKTDISEDVTRHVFNVPESYADIADDEEILRTYNYYNNEDAENLQFKILISFIALISSDKDEQIQTVSAVNPHALGSEYAKNNLLRSLNDQENADAFGWHRPSGWATQSTKDRFVIFNRSLIVLNYYIMLNNNLPENFNNFNYENLLDLKREVEEVFDHEMRHAIQHVITRMRNLQNDDIQKLAGIPVRASGISDDFDEEGNFTGPHALRNIEFYPRLSDEINSFVHRINQWNRAVDHNIFDSERWDEGLRLLIRIWTSQINTSRYHPYIYNREFFTMLRDNKEEMYKKAIKEFYKEVMDRLPS